MLINVILLIVLYPIVFMLYYFQVKKNGIFKDGCLFGAEASKEWMEKEHVKKMMLQYAKQTRIITGIFLILPVAFFFVPYVSIQFTCWMAWFFAYMICSQIPYLMQNEQFRKWKYDNKLEDEQARERDNCWKSGIFYYNAKDKRSSVQKRNGEGNTMNFASFWGRAVAFVTILTLIMIPLFCTYMIVEQFTPIKVNVQGDYIVANQVKTKYTIDISQIEKYSLISTLPNRSKSTGTGMDNLEKGIYYVFNEGKCTEMLNPENGIFLRIEINDKRYYLSGKNDIETRQLFETIRRKKAGR